MSDEGNRPPGLNWLDRAACRGVAVEIMFPSNGEYSPAKKVCAGCPVISECGAQSLLDDDRHGCFGGMTPYERRRLRSQLGLAPKRPPLAPHGTMAAVKRHYRHGEPLCEPCKVAQTCWQNPEQKPMGGKRAWR